MKKAFEKLSVPAPGRSASPTRPEPRQCVCGLMVEPVSIGKVPLLRWFSHDLCSDCQRIQQLKREESARLAAVRQNRIVYTRELTEKIKTVIPPLYLGARLGHLSKPLFKIVDSGDSLYLWGGVGVGKTYAAMAIARAAIITGESVPVICFDAFLAKIRSDFNSEEILLAHCVEADLLVIDDLGVTNSDFGCRILLRIIDGRLSMMRKTIITSNLSLELLAKAFGQRVVSRLHTYTVVQLTGPDRRRRK